MVAYVLLVLLVALNSVEAATQIDPARLKALRANTSSAKGMDFEEFVDLMYKQMQMDMGDKKGSSSMNSDFELQRLAEMDKSIDPKTYVLGANDQLTIFIWGSVSNVLTAIVDYEGNVMIPSVGIISVGGMTLADGKLRVIEKMLQVYKEVEISIVLSQIREFKAYVLGGVVRPGANKVNGATRVSDIIEMSGGFANKDTARIRGIEITNETTQKTRYADLALFFNYNDISGNPYLMEGDRIFVGDRREIVSVAGEVHNGGTYDYMEGDFAGSLIRAAGGCKRGADSSRIVLTRFADNCDSLVNYTLSFSEAQSFPLEKDDRILVCRKPDYREHRNVWLVGEVLYPGQYPIRKEKTRLRDIIAQAGGITEMASLDQSMMFRKSTVDGIEDGMEIMDKLPPASLNPVEKAYFKAKFAEKEGLVSIDFSKLANDDNEIYNLVLKDGDSIIIAEKSLTVEVQGAVVMPGHVVFKDGANSRYYIHDAGGFSSRARKSHTVVIRGNSGVWLRQRDIDQIHAGDVILVPEKEYKVWYTVARDMLVILSSIAAVITTYLAVSSALKE